MDEIMNPGYANSGRKKKRSFSKNLLLILVIIIFFLGGLGVGLIKYYQRDLPSIATLENYAPELITKVYAADGTLLKEFWVEKRERVNLDDIPQYLVMAVLASEDRKFYDHWGVDFVGILRAIIADIKERKIIQGASTITQQLARNLFLTHEQTFNRKIKEVILALEIERTYTKDEILEMYFNQIYFGSVYGVQSAALHYFGKPAKKLNLPECATLAGFIRVPGVYNKGPNLAVLRRAIILNSMADAGFISYTEAATAKNFPINIKPPNKKSELGPYFVEYVRQQLEHKYGAKRLYEDGLRVYTTLDPKLQASAEQLVEEHLQFIENQPDYKYAARGDSLMESHRTKDGNLDEIYYLQGALVAIEPETGYIRALVGGRGFEDSRFNRAVQAPRQPGSAFKPFVYTAAIDNGIPTSKVIIDAPIWLDQPDGTKWQPSNYGGKFNGPLTLREGLRRSINLVAIKLGMEIGPSTVVEYAHRMGIESPLLPVESLAIGAAEVTPLEITTAYSVFPNRGIKVSPIAIMRVEDSEGNIIDEFKPFKEEVLREQTTFVMTSLLQDVIRRGTGVSAFNYGFNRIAGGKTGTTNNYIDAWFIGFTPELVCGVWVGFDQPKEIIRNGTGARLALPIWAKFMKAAHDSLPPSNFPAPTSGIVSRNICADSGLLAIKECPRDRVFTEVFVKGVEPTNYCDVHKPSLNIDENFFFKQTKSEDNDEMMKNLPGDDP